MMMSEIGSGYGYSYSGREDIEISAIEVEASEAGSDINGGDKGDGGRDSGSSATLLETSVSEWMHECSTVSQWYSQ
jgi:hypothetical protein